MSKCELVPRAKKTYTFDEVRDRPGVYQDNQFRQTYVSLGGTVLSMHDPQRPVPLVASSFTFTELDEEWTFQVVSGQLRVKQRLRSTSGFSPLSGFLCDGLFCFADHPDAFPVVRVENGAIVREFRADGVFEDPQIPQSQQLFTKFDGKVIVTYD